MDLLPNILKLILLNLILFLEENLVLILQLLVLQLELNFFLKDAEEQGNGMENGLSKYQQIYLKLLEQQRMLLNRMNTHEEFDEEVIRKYLALTDMEEFKLREKLIEG